MYLIGIVSYVVGALVFILALFAVLFRQKPTLIFDKYPSKGGCYYLKYRLALLVVDYLRRKYYPEKGPDNFDELDKPQVLGSNPHSYDCVSFMAANQNGEKIMISLERRQRGVVKACCYLWLPKDGLYCSPNLPDMVYFTTDGDEGNPDFRGAGLHIYSEECMRIWRIVYDGELRHVATNQILTVKMNLLFKSSPAYFNYNRDLSASVIADSVAREAWDDSFFGMLESIGQIVSRRVHYEQTGILQGSVQLGEQELNIDLKGFRDHGFGTERSLSTINRYVYVALFLDDGTNMVIGNLSQPSFFLSSLKVGYVCTPDGVYKPITTCTFELYSYGEKGSPPKHKNFVVETAENKYFVQIEEQDAALRFVGGEWQSKVFNQFIRCTVNGINGQGLTEYLYRHDGGRPRSVSSSDPEWYQNIKSTSNTDDGDDEVFTFETDAM